MAEPQSSRAELLFVEHEPLDFAAAARAALEACGFRILRPDAVARVSGVPAIFAGATSIPASAEPLWRTLIASGNPVLALVKADDFAHAEWLDKAADVIVWPPASGELAFRVGRWFGVPPGGENQSALRRLLEQAGIVGHSAALLSALAGLPNIAASPAPVLITGETGTGKDLVARALHYGSARRGGPFVPVNCGALPENLFENELFGHVKGAYTHAHGAQLGLIARADHGTLFLDEIDALSLRSQVALLRFLQDGHYLPLGASASRHADVRVLAATNRPLEIAVAEGRFRNDLFYRLDILGVSLPPLRARAGDIRLIAEAILARLAREHRQTPKRLSESALRAIERESWPGNVRELEAALYRAALVTSGSVIAGWPPRREMRLQTLSDEPNGPFHKAKRAAIDAFEHRYLVRLIGATSGNVSAASRMAGTERRTLGRLLTKHGIDPATYRAKSTGNGIHSTSL